MKVIYPNNVSSVTADAENASFPDDNLNDKHPKKLLKGTGNEHTLNVVVAGGVNQGANLAPKVTCTDPDNDTDVTTGWTAGNAATLSSESGGNSGKCLKILCDGTNNPSATSSSFSVEAGKVYRVAFYHKDIDGTSDSPQWYVQDTENGNAKINTSGATVTEAASTSWVQVSDVFEAPNTSDGIQIVLIHQATAGDADAYYFDDVTFYEVNYGNGFALYNTNATQVTATVRLGQDAQWGSGTQWDFSTTNTGSNLAPISTCTDPNDDQDVTTGWGSLFSSTLSSESGGNTGNCLKVLGNGENNPSARKTGISVTGGKSYELSFYHKDIDATGDSPEYRIKDNNNNIVYKAFASIAVSSTWIKESFAFTATANSTNVPIILRHSATAGDADAYYFDDVTFYEVTKTNTAQWYAGESGTTTTYDLNPAGVGSMWGDYSKVGADHIIQLDLVAASGTVLEAGVVVAGIVNTFNDPKYGINEGLFDFSIVKELNNGAIYTRKRDTVRTFSWSILDDRDPDFYTFFRTIGQQIGPDPLGWRLVHVNLTDWNWVVYCRFNNMPSGQHRHITQSDINANLIEVV